MFPLDVLSLATLNEEEVAAFKDGAEKINVGTRDHPLVAYRKGRKVLVVSSEAMNPPKPIKIEQPHKIDHDERGETWFFYKFTGYFGVIAGARLTRSEVEAELTAKAGKGKLIKEGEEWLWLPEI